ncbi:phospho-N-acetylmuramoyl-pentapeptide-transferase [Dellaglioa algida]|uniref:phospho-N-acetylmuramoyl-pentapeptide- transferase n=1 Tax=Dellaglioa algida TaxID=105612 RepID=UPI0024C4C4E0|nr:phospho-N-acetylmuramoyl-pentapeptide-transferase [Dellaglioa algida]MDK1718234.1 phospho-N-acetylmuramoyl-pentapeptide-transferase [Dellaglioa algida]
MTKPEMIIPLVSGFALTFMFMPLFIGYFRMRKQGQMIREEGPKWHEKKSGTPTMGGFVFNIAIIITAIWTSIWAKTMTPAMLILIFILFLYAVLGFWDDSIKLFKRQNEGLKAWQKLLGQIVGGLILTGVYMHEQLPLSINILGFGEVSIGILYAVFIIIWLVGFSNAVNLTDGIDGLVAGQAIIAFVAYAVVAHVQHQDDVLIFCLSVIGALIAFIWFNHKPAKVFMGDMGSLALGGALATVSILLHQELSLIFIGIIFVCETASVILQVASFKLTGKRIFKMSPIHHHFEMSGWNEWKIDIVFWTIGLIFAILTLLVIL